jgi:hypothetical protein
VAANRPSDRNQKAKEIQMFNFGIELEFNTHDARETVVERIRSTGLRAGRASYSENLPSAWSVKADGSVNGWEVVSPVLSLDDVRAQVPVLCNALQACEGADARRDCGFHIHISGFESVELVTLRNVFRRFVNFEDTLDLLQPEGRRGSNNSYCKSNAALFGRSKIEQNAAIWERVHAAQTREALMRMFNPNGDRYFKLNAQSLLRHGTLELRHPAGTIDAQTVLHTVEFFNAFVRVAIQQERLWRRPTHTPETQGDRFRKLMRGVPAPTRQHMAQRMVALNGSAWRNLPA